MTDFIQYWSSYRAILEGLNPYDPAVQLIIQQSVDPNISTPIMSWNPPWLSLLMAPVLIFPYEQSLLLWRVVSGILFVLSIIVIDKELKNSKSSQVLLAIPICAVFETMLLGQVGGIIALASSLLFVGTIQKNNSKIVVGTILASVKPHLFLIFCFYVFLNKQYWKALLYSLLSLSFLIVWSLLISSGSINQWIFACLNDQSIITNHFNWKPASISFLINSLVEFRIPVYFYLAFGLGIALVFIKKVAPYSLGILFGISYLFSGYGWVFDQGIFTPLRFVALQFGFIYLLIVDALAMYARFEVFKFQHEFVWYALAQTLVCIYIFQFRELKAGSGMPNT